MSNELEELGEYILIVLEKMKVTEKRVRKLENSVDSINKVIEEATEEAIPTEENPQQTAPPMPLRFWLPLNAAKLAGILSAIYWVANIVARQHLVAWNQTFPADWGFWITLEAILAGVSLAAVIGIDIFFFFLRKRRTRRPTAKTLEEIEETQTEANEPTTQSSMIEQTAK